MTTPNSALEFYSSNGWANRVGISIQTASKEQVSIYLPYDEQNLNAPGGVVHGGVIGTLIHDAGYLLTQLHYPDTPSALIKALDIQVNYITAAFEADLTATAKLVRSSRALAFVDIEVHNKQGAVVARSHALYRIAGADEEVIDLRSQGLYDIALGSDVPYGEFAEKISPNVAAHAPGLSVTGWADSQVRTKLENLKENQDHDGIIAPGLQMLVLDDVGVFASFSRVRKGGRPASTIDLKISFCQTPTDENVIGYGHCIKQQNQVINNQVLLFGETSHNLIAIGTMTFWAP